MGDEHGLWARHTERTSTPVLRVALGLLVASGIGSLIAIALWCVGGRRGPMPVLVGIGDIVFWISLCRIIRRELRRRASQAVADARAASPRDRAA